jgi:hypothetical protein
MTEHDDYDIIEEPRESRRTLSTTQWVTLLAAIAIVIFSVGLALGTLTSRFGRGEAPPVETLPPSQGSPTAVAIVGTPVVTATATLTTPMPTPSLTPSTTPTPSPTVACAVPIDGQFAGSYDRATFGCATAPANIYWAAWEPFERGGMLWRSDTNQAYALFDNGEWQTIDQGWDGQEIPSRGEPPSGLQAPTRGFGYAWAVRDELFNRLGWARTEEKGFCALIQPLERGFLLQSSTVEFCQENLYNTAREPGWTPLQLAIRNDGRWQTLGSITVAPSVPPTPAPVVSGGISRPPENGSFVAAAVSPQIDGELGEWPDRWAPISAVVQGPENYTGADDLSGVYQIGWSSSGIYVALRVNDDRYRGGPTGTNLWQGDGLEFHLDRDLQGDFNNPQADGDDYQVGVGFGPSRSQVLGYRWLPLAQEGAFTPTGAVVAQGEGYSAELLFPWSVFGLPNETPPVRTFGFMLSINDNDQDAPAQQTVLSTAPRRTTFDRPDEWGTLVLE